MASFLTQPRVATEPATLMESVTDRTRGVGRYVDPVLYRAARYAVTGPHPIWMTRVEGLRRLAVESSALAIRIAVFRAGRIAVEQPLRGVDDASWTVERTITRVLFRKGLARRADRLQNWAKAQRIVPTQAPWLSGFAMSASEYPMAAVATALDDIASRARAAAEILSGSTLAGQPASVYAER